MAPDFEYFFRMNVLGIYGHTFWGLFYFDLPLSLLIALLFHLIAKKNLIDNLPYFVQSRFHETREMDFVRYLKDHKVIFIMSAILGSATHVIWDGFTHGAQFGVKALPMIYEGRTVDFDGVHYPLWYALQAISTCVGGVIIVIYFFFMKTPENMLYKPVASYWLLLVLMVAVITYARMQFGFGNLWYVILIVTICSAFCISITILGLVPFRKQLRNEQ